MSQLIHLSMIYTINHNSEFH